MDFDLEKDTPDQRDLDRMELASTADGRMVSVAFVDTFGRFMRDDVRPVLRRMAADGGDPQLLVNGLAELLRMTADSIERPVGQARQAGHARWA